MSRRSNEPERSRSRSLIDLSCLSKRQSGYPRRNGYSALATTAPMPHSEGCSQKRVRCFPAFVRRNGYGLAVSHQPCLSLVSYVYGGAPQKQVRNAISHSERIRAKCALAFNKPDVYVPHAREADRIRYLGSQK